MIDESRYVFDLDLLSHHNLVLDLIDDLKVLIGAITRDFWEKQTDPEAEIFVLKAYIDPFYFNLKILQDGRSGSCLIFFRSMLLVSQFAHVEAKSLLKGLQRVLLQLAVLA